MGTIRLLNLAFFGHHGVSRAERETGTRLDVDVELSVNTDPASANDELDQTVDYVAVHREVEDVVNTDRHKLLESLGHAIATRLLGRFEITEAVTVRIRKGNLPLSGGSVEVELRRTRA